MKILNNRSSLLNRRKELRNNATPEEVLLWSKLKHSQLGFKFRRQHSIGGYIVDFYCPSKKLVIEIDGPQHLTKESKEYDKVRTKFFEGLNIRTIRFSNIEVNLNLNNVLKNIKEKLNFPPPCGGGGRGW